MDGKHSTTLVCCYCARLPNNCIVAILSQNTIVAKRMRACSLRLASTSTSTIAMYFASTLDVDKADCRLDGQEIRFSLRMTQNSEVE